MMNTDSFCAMGSNKLTVEMDKFGHSVCLFREVFVANASSQS